MVPKIIHITFKDKPNPVQELIINQWKGLNPDFEIKIYTDKDNYEFCQKHFPQYTEVYNKIEKNICKIDFIRLLYLYKWGGVYVDSDVLPLKPIEPLLKISEVLLFKENEKNNSNFNLDKIISNAIIFSTSQNPFIKKLIDEIISKAHIINNHIESTDVLNLTGPFLLNKVYSIWPNRSEITLLDGKYFNPMNFYDLKDNFISDEIRWSFGVHLFEGGWWQNEYKPTIDLIQKIQNKYNTLISNEPFPLISCLCITKNEEKLVNLSIDCFRKQIYPNKELIIVYEDNNSYIENIIKNNQDKNIKYFKIDSNPKKTLGELRNISIESSNGEYIAQWDDDDWHNPIRLWEQYYTLKKYNKNGSILRKWLVYDERNNLLYERERTDLIGWEGSLLFKKSEIKDLYQNLTRGEDTGFVQKIENQIQPIFNPELYIYRVHYNNTWDYRKLKIDIIDPGKIYKDQSFIFKLKNEQIVNNNPQISHPLIKDKIGDIKVLCFTTSYQRLKMLRGSILDIKNQTYPHTYHSINITNNELIDNELFLRVFDDLVSDSCFIHFNINENQHINHIKPILSTPNLDDYDIFVKIDDDDFYKENYIENIVNVFKQNDVDIVSSKAKLIVNNNKVYIFEQDSLGGNPEGCDFKIPATFAFNRKALNLIINIDGYYGFEDNMWRDTWCNNKCKILEVDNTNEYVLHVHGKNISTSNSLIE